MQHSQQAVHIQDAGTSWECICLAQSASLRQATQFPYPNTARAVTKTILSDEAITTDTRIVEVMTLNCSYLYRLLLFRPIGSLEPAQFAFGQRKRILVDK